MKRDKRTDKKQKLLLTKQRVRELTPVQDDQLDQVNGGDMVSWPTRGGESC